MTIRFINRFTFHRFPMTPHQLVGYPTKKVRFLTPKPDHPIEMPPNFAEGSQYRQQVAVSNLLQRYGFPASQLHEFLKKNRFLLTFSLSDMEQSLSTLLSFKLPQRSLVSILCACPGVLEIGFLKKWEMCFSKLEFARFTPLAIKNVVEYSTKFQLCPADLYQCLRVLKDAGFNDDTVTRVFEEFPSVIMMNESSLDRKIGFLSSIGIRRNQIDRIVFLFPGILGFGVEDRLKPLLREFEDLGFSDDEVIQEIIGEPRILGMELGELSRCLELIRALRCREAIKEKILRDGTLRAGFNIKLRVDCLCRYGLIRRDAFTVLQREPRALIYDLKDIEEKIEFLIHRIQFSIDSLIEVPEYLGVNFEKQIVSRFNVIEYLKMKGGLGTDVRLKGLIKPSRLRFYNLYVKPYPECENFFGKFSRDAEVKTRHPVGLWKLFKPQSYQESEEDLRNIKLFMKPLC